MHTVYTHCISALTHIVCFSSMIFLIPPDKTYFFLATMAAGPKPQEGDDPAVLAADGGKSKWVLGGVAIMMQTDT